MIALACDHGALALKEAIKAHLEQQGLEYKDFGAAAARAVASGACEKGIVCCTTGIGISIAANKIKGVRCALLHDHMSARLTRQHNNANMMALGAAVTPPMMALELVDIFLNTPFEGGRHQRRVDKISALEG